MKELVYTSARTGLRPGSTGFCTVAMSDGLSAAIVEFLERLSNTYRPIYMPYDARAADNPVAISLIRVRLGGQLVTVLSRNGAADVDHTGRSNNLAHHLVFESLGPPTGANPASMAATPGSFLNRWDDEPRRLMSRRLPDARGPSGICSQWHELTGDAGWAATVASAWATREGRPLYLIYPAQTDILGLMTEAISLLPPERRWEATFTTYYTGLPPEATCAVRAVLAGTPQEAEARRGDHVDLMDIVGSAPDGPLADRARGRHSTEDQVLLPPTAVQFFELQHIPASPNSTEPLDLRANIVDDEPPPLNQSAQILPAKQPERFVRNLQKTGTRWAHICAIAFAAWALVSTGSAVFLAVGWIQATKEFGDRNHVTPSGEMTSDSPKAKTDKNDQTVGESSNLPKTGKQDQALNANSTAPDSKLKTVELERDKLKKERDDKAAQLTQQQSRAETAELAKNKAIADKVTAERKLADEKRQGASVNNLILRLKTQSALENAIGVRQLQVDKNDAKLWEQINKAVVLGSFELERTQLKAKTGSGSDVLKIDARLNLGSVTPSSKFIGYYLSEPTTLARTTYLPKSIDQAKQKIIPIHRSPDSKDENEKGFFYIANDLPQEVNAVENWIFVMIDENEKPPVSYLLRLTKFQK